MKKILKMVAMIAILLPTMIACSGGGDSEAIIFGKFPSVFEKFLKEKDKLEAEKANIKTEADKAAYLKKVDELKAKWTEKLETAAKTADGQVLELADGNIKVTEPITLTFEKLDKDLEPSYTINGKAEAAADIPTFESIAPGSGIIYLKGYDEEGNEVFSSKVGIIPSNVDKKGFITAGAEVKFNKLYYSEKSTEAYLKAKTLKLETPEVKAGN